jgi:hypothetical protein
LIVVIPLIVIAFAKLLLDRLGNEQSMFNVLHWSGLHSAHASLTDKTSDHAAIYQKAKYFILAVSMFLLIFLNTVLYLADTYSRGLRNERGFRKASTWLNYCWHGAVALLVGNTVLLAYMAWVDGGCNVMTSQRAGLAFFLIFAVLDFCAYRALKLQVVGLEKRADELSSAIADEDKRTLSETACDLTKCRRDADYVLKQALYVDAPVILGLGFVWLFHHYYLLKDGTGCAEAFAMGATLMHLATSQLLFLFVSFDDAYHEYRSDTEEEIVIV